MNFQPFGLLHGFEVVGNQQFHALEVKIRCVAEPGQLKHIHHFVNCQPFSQSLGAALLQLSGFQPIGGIEPVIHTHRRSKAGGGIEPVQAAS
ncbi:hypothetical protein U1Q18_041699 [Sarracenia purpurea var. burkii]